MSEFLGKYEKRLRGRDIKSFDVSILKEIDQFGSKFDLNGNAKPFYGLTCIACIDRETRLFHELCDFQNMLREEFKENGLGDIFAFLNPESFHMTVCDIVTSSDPIQFQSHHASDLIKLVRLAFEQIGILGNVICQIQGVGLKRTITILVKFNNEIELRKVLDIEHKIKQLTGVNVREFLGHISLAYFVRHPEQKNETIKKILFQYKDKDFGEFSISEIYLAYFTNMNTFKPILAMNIENGRVTRHGISLNNY